MLEDIPLTVIGEADILELNAARPDFCDLPALGRFIILLVNQGKDPVGRNHGSLQNGKVLGDFNQRVEELVGVLNECIHKPRGHTSHLPGDPEIGQDNGIGQELKQGHGRPQEEAVDIEGFIGIGHMVCINGLKFCQQTPFLAEGLDNSHALNAFRQLNVQIAQLSPGHSNQIARLTVVEGNRAKHNGNKDQHKQGQGHIETKHGPNSNRHNDQGAEEAREDSTEHISHCLSIIGQAGHDGPGWRLVEVSHGQALQLVEGLLA